MVQRDHAKHLLSGLRRGDQGSHIYGWQQALSIVVKGKLELHGGGLLRNSWESNKLVEYDVALMEQTDSSMLFCKPFTGFQMHSPLSSIEVLCPVPLSDISKSAQAMMAPMLQQLLQRGPLMVLPTETGHLMRLML